MNPRPQMSVLMTTDTVGGVWIYSTTLASALALAGIAVTLVTIGPVARSDQLGTLRNKRIRLIETDLALEWQDPEGRDVLNARRALARIEHDIEPNLVHLNSFREAAFDWQAPMLAVAHSCVNSWALACGDTNWLEEPRWQRYSKAVAAGLNAAQAWVSPSRAFGRVMTSLYRPGSPATVIRHGITPAISYGAKRNYVLAAGRLWDRAKNVATLAEAAKGLPWPLLVAGPADRNVPSGPIWLGNLAHEDLCARMRHAAIFASPALYEPFGLAVLEAASAGCALILSDIPTFRELWDGAALFIDPNDTQALHRALANVCADHRQRRRLQRAARERSGRYLLADMSQAYQQLYGSLLAMARRYPVSTQPTGLRA